MNNYLAVDIGASSGRVVWGTLRDGALRLREIHRFSNGFHEKDGKFCWDIEYLFEQILLGLRKAKALGIETCTLGIDTWAVDYVLMDREGERIGEVYAYRDPRTNGAPELLHRHIPFQEIYAKTGIQQLSFNTLYQLYVHDREELKAAEHILLVPDYLHFRLCGVLKSEATNASTTQLLNLHTQDYDAELLALLGLQRSRFPELVRPGARLGFIREELVRAHGLPRCEVICAATHDTASAVLGVPAQGTSWGYLSSGTWSLIGVERERPLTSRLAMEYNYTNEWGAFGTYRFLKNMMGMWLIQQVRKELGNAYSFAELAELAATAEPFRSLIPCSDDRFMNPPNMTEAIRSFCRQSGQPVPASPGELARCIFDSMALSYDVYVRELEHVTGEPLKQLHIVGGGSNNAFLCQLGADLLGMEIYAGPTEATVLGNLAVQMIADGAIRDLGEAREMIRHSFEIRKYEPRPEDPARLKELRDRYRSLG
ncbi:MULTISPECIES: rhamnulokinase [Paenibacillus]|uniref:Rhamnulokinase n=1 Tax=Paenibacillus albilobatus TaxID=2716884 RepID=A0A919XCQ7_9BACL|nr:MULTISPECIES: rhamnulokinase [Paenibacillus]GIO30257.1 rhamnulokinase [Paenibacillus albilobatus]